MILPSATELHEELKVFDVSVIALVLCIVNEVAALEFVIGQPNASKTLTEYEPLHKFVIGLSVDVFDQITEYGKTPPLGTMVIEPLQSPKQRGSFTFACPKLKAGFSLKVNERKALHKLTSVTFAV